MKKRARLGWGVGVLLFGVCFFAGGTQARCSKKITLGALSTAKTQKLARKSARQKVRKKGRRRCGRRKMVPVSRWFYRCRRLKKKIRCRARLQVRCCKRGKRAVRRRSLRRRRPPRRSLRRLASRRQPTRRSKVQRRCGKKFVARGVARSSKRARAKKVARQRARFGARRRCGKKRRLVLVGKWRYSCHRAKRLHRCKARIQVRCCR